MKFNLIASQGRIADKTELTIKGAALTAGALERRYGVKAITVGTPSPPAQEDWRVSLSQAKETLVALQEAITTSVESRKLTVMVSNTCSASLASLPVMARHYPDAILLWVDAHGDFNTPETTDTGYLGGMVLAAACGLWDSGYGAGLRPTQVILVGARDIDHAEHELLRQAGVRIIRPAAVTPEAVLQAVGEAKVWIHIDWDVLEPGHVPADYKVAGGLLPSQIRALLTQLPADRVLGLELAEYQVPSDNAEAQSALSTILTIVGPLLD